MTKTDIDKNALAAVRLLALDIDGTLLTDDKRLTERTGAALQRALAAGVACVPVTGRPFSGMPQELLGIPGMRYVISSNGAVTDDLKTGQKLRKELIDPETAAQILRIPLERGLIYNVFIDGMGYSDPSSFERLTGIFKGTVLEDYVERSRRCSDDVLGLLRASEGAENIWMIAEDGQHRDALNSLIMASWDVRTVLTARRDIEVGSPRADKGLALQQLAGHLGIGREQILAIGDNENDLGMFRAAGIAVAMGNATDASKQAADLITAGNSEDGAAMVIEAVLRAME